MQPMKRNAMLRFMGCPVSHQQVTDYLILTRHKMKSPYFTIVSARSLEANNRLFTQLPINQSTNQPIMPLLKLLAILSIGFMGTMNANAE